MTELDSRIERALASVGQRHGFDKKAYIAAFAASAQEKANAVLGLLEQERDPFRRSVPVFVSVGGGDGTELRELMKRSKANVGMLIEKTPVLVQLARESAQIAGKSIECYAGDAQQTIDVAVTRARQVVERGDADFVAVTCHAVIHELFDRGADAFDPLSFFGAIFGDENAPSTWFTYREPGDPEKWPQRVLIKAACAPTSLLNLAQAICARHRSLAGLKPVPRVVGEHLFLHRTLAMETLAKLFYLEDLAYEIEERSTSVNHQGLESALMLAIGRLTCDEGRGAVRSSSEPTKSFERYWFEHQVSIDATLDDGATRQLGIPESQTRVVAWRVARGKPAVIDEAIPRIDETGEGMALELEMARSALATSNEPLLFSVLSSFARAWIESRYAAEATEFIKTVRRRKCGPAFVRMEHIHSEHLPFVRWGEGVAGSFSGEAAARANEVGLGVLFDAERMEFQRKNREFDKAIEAANTLVQRLPLAVESLGPEERYAYGTASYLVANLLRHGGRYDQALPYIESAQRAYVPGIASHDTELAHCEYGEERVRVDGGQSYGSASRHGASRWAAFRWRALGLDLLTCRLVCE